MAAVCRAHDDFAKVGVRAHLPKSALSGTAKVVVKGLPTDYEEEEIIEALAEVELKDLYMFKKRHSGEFTGVVKCTIKGSKKLKEWLDQGKASVEGISIVERERTL